MAIWDDVVPKEEQELYERGGWGGTVGYGRRPALLVVDMYRAFVDPAYPYSSPSAPATVRVIQPLLAAARDAECPVFFFKARRRTIPAERGRWKTTAVSTRPVMADPAAYEIVPELAPRPTESVIVKSAPSAFFGTDLVSYLIFHNVDTVIVTGTVTSGCVRDTVLDAFNYSFRVIVPVEAVCDRGATSHKVTLFDLQMKYADVVPASGVLEYLSTVHHGEQEHLAGARSS